MPLTGWPEHIHCFMKRPISVIITVVLLLISVVRLANTCSKREKRQKTRDFNEWLTKVRIKKDSIMAYHYFAPGDSLAWMTDHKKSFDKTLDSSIQYYQDHYTQDEKRYKAYLNTLFEYKKLSYLYSSWIKSSRISENPAKMEKDYQLLTFPEFQKKERQILFNMGKVNIDLIMMD
jgi:hypothetical protein